MDVSIHDFNIVLLINDSFYVFDAVPMLPCVALFMYWHPAKFLPYLGFRLPRHARI
jgi:hypothetical protein